MRSAYYDRVLSTKLYYRIYLENTPPADPLANPANFSDVALSETISPLPLTTCFTSTQNDPWSNLSLGVNVLSGLSTGNVYILEFFVEATLKDVGDDEYAPGNCTMLDPAYLCLETADKNRVLHSTYSTTDPNHCNYASIVSGQSLPHKIRFKYVTALPLSWTAFSAERIAQDVSLTWDTELELNVDHYEIERSTDAARWEVIDFVKATNAGPLRSHYELLDAFAPAPALFYRIRSIDFDHAYVYSPAVSVAPSEGGALLEVQPNPAGNYVYIQVANGTNVSIYGQDGRLVFNEPESAGLIRVETIDWTSGVYIVVLLSDSGEVLERKALLVGQ
ncbi:MAG: T9SS type A sorting domain-containing protein [Saprospiraceae bacterium]